MRRASRATEHVSKDVLTVVSVHRDPMPVRMDGPWHIRATTVRFASPILPEVFIRGTKSLISLGLAHSGESPVIGLIMLSKSTILVLDAKLPTARNRRLVLSLVGCLSRPPLAGPKPVLRELCICLVKSPDLQDLLGSDLN